ncbi:hypothetical protein F4677DRAFT_442151 [Hypoxylon crocopeplum]|nr:hypothetical protein F4677DRAFT_442151 [Hypoxylon crocopeplum]
MSISKSIVALALAYSAQATITVVWQGGSCASPSGPTLDISPIGINTCTLYNFFPNNNPQGHLSVTISGTSDGLAVFQLPPSQENQHIQCGSLQGIFHQSGCYDSVTPALDVVTAECDQTGCNNLEGIPPNELIAQIPTTKKEKRDVGSFMERRQSSCSGSTSVSCDGCVDCFSQGVRVSPFISCPAQGNSCAAQLTQQITVEDSFTISVGVEDVFTANVETTHSIAVTNSNSQTFTVNPGQAGFVQYEPLAQCGFMTVHNGDGSICAQAEGTFILNNQGAGGQFSFVRTN